MTTVWIDTLTGEISRSRVAPAHRVGVRKFLMRFDGRALEVARWVLRGGGYANGVRRCAADFRKLGGP